MHPGREEEIDKRKAWEKVLLMGKPDTRFMKPEEKLNHQDEAVADLKGGQKLVMSRLEEQRQTVSQALENQYHRITVIESSQKQVEE
nr:unnamed protein product [Callosobruchus chinensis]